MLAGVVSGKCSPADPLEMWHGRGILVYKYLEKKQARKNR